MVAISGTGWYLAPSLVALIEETDDRYPTRDRASDGSIGDAAHAARESQHNPENGWVCAVDIDEDLSSGLHSLNELARHVVDQRDHRVRYLIYEGRICKSYVDANGRAAWVWQTYTGLNDHSHHLHVSVWNTPVARDDTGPWWPTPDPVEEDEDMPYLLAAPGKATRLVDGLTSIGVSSATAEAAKNQGVKVLTVTAKEYDSHVAQVKDTLD